MKIKSVFFALLALSLTACNNNDEPDAFEAYPIVQSFIPQTLYIKRFYDLDKAERARYSNGSFVVNSLDELPENEFFSNSIFEKSNIDFANTTLLINQWLLPVEISGYGYRWGYSNIDKQTQFISGFNRLSTEDPLDGATYVRTAILVRKLPADLDVHFINIY